MTKLHHVQMSIKLSISCSTLKRSAKALFWKLIFAQKTNIRMHADVFSAKRREEHSKCVPSVRDVSAALKGRLFLVCCLRCREERWRNWSWPSWSNNLDSPHRHPPDTNLTKQHQTTRFTKRLWFYDAVGENTQIKHCRTLTLCWRFEVWSLIRSKCLLNVSLEHKSSHK